jgi:hypothetical protein
MAILLANTEGRVSIEILPVISMVAGVDDSVHYSAPFHAFGKWYSFRSDSPVMPEGQSNHFSAVMPAQ